MRIERMRPHKMLAKMVKESGITQAEIAARMAISQPHLSAILSGRTRLYYDLYVELLAAIKKDATITDMGDDLAGMWLNRFAERTIEAARAQDRVPEAAVVWAIRHQRGAGLMDDDDFEVMQAVIGRRVRDPVSRGTIMP